MEDILHAGQCICVHEWCSDVEEEERDMMLEYERWLRACERCLGEKNDSRQAGSAHSLINSGCRSGWIYIMVHNIIIMSSITCCIVFPRYMATIYIHKYIQHKDSQICLLLQERGLCWFQRAGSPQ